MTVDLVQVSDVHVVNQPGQLVYGQPSDDNLRRTLAACTNERAPDLVVATGDVTDDAAPTGYRRVASALRASGEVVRWLPGNHDDPSLMEAVEPGWSNPVELGRWIVVPLDSRWDGEVAGRLGAAELERLQRLLTEAVDRHMLLCLHHPPVHGVSDDPDCQLTDAASLVSLVDAHPCVRAVISGHLHRAFDVERGGVRYLGAPSTCVQVRHEGDLADLTDEPPAGRIITLDDDGTVLTRLVEARP